MHSELLKGLSLRYITRALQCILNSLRDCLWDTFRNILTMWLPGGSHAPTSPPGPPPPPWLHFWNEWVINQRCLFKPCFDTQPMAFPSEINYSPAAPHCPSPWPSTAQHLCLCLHLLFFNNYLPTMQYNWLESETQYSSMHSVLNSLRNRLWFNQLKDTETWSWNVMLWITYLSHSLSSLNTTLLTSPPLPSPMLLSPLLPSHL